MVFNHLDNVNSRHRIMFLYKSPVDGIIKMSYKQFSASRCAASLLLHIITIGKQQPGPSPQLLHQQYYFLQKDKREEHEKEQEEVGKQ
jgi:hypothetical protein